MVSPYLLDVIIMLLAAVVAVPLSQALKLGAVPGFLISGVIVGPFGLGLIENISEIRHIAEFGVVFLLFVIGIGLKPSRLWQMRRLVFGLGGLQVVLTGVLISGIAYFLFDVSLPAAILIGPTLALSSTAFVLQLLSENKQLTSSYGRSTFAVLLMQDIAVVPLLALVPLLVLPELSMGDDVGIALAEALVILALVVVLGRYLLHPILHRVAVSGNSELFTASAVLIVLGTAIATEHAGFSMAMGAFLAGLLISDSSYKHQIQAEVAPFRGLLLGLFFMSMGMSLNIGLLFDNPARSVAIVALLIVLKTAILFPLAYLFKLGVKNSLAVAIVLAQSGEFALVLFSLAFEAELLSEMLYQELLLVVLLSMLATPILADIAHRLIKSKRQVDVPATPKPVTAPIVLAGFGRVGRRIGEILYNAGKPFVALDVDADIVERARAEGYPVFYGDVRKPEVLSAAGAREAKIIIVTLDDGSATEQVVENFRTAHPDKEIYVRCQGLRQCRLLKSMGATGVVPENVEASLELARISLMSAGVKHEQGESILADFREKYHAQIDEAAE